MKVFQMQPAYLCSSNRELAFLSTTDSFQVSVRGDDALTFAWEAVSLPRLVYS